MLKESINELTESVSSPAELINKIRGHEIYKTQPLPIYGGSIIHATIYYTINNKSYNFVVKFMIQISDEEGFEPPSVGNLISLIVKGFIENSISALLSKQVKFSALRLRSGEAFDTGKVIITGYYGKQAFSHEPYPMQFILSTISPMKQQSLRLYGVPGQFEQWDQQGNEKLITYVEQFCSGFQRKIFNNNLTIYSVGVHPFKSRSNSFTRVGSVIPTNFIRDKKLYLEL